MAEAVSRFDWAATPLGAADTWPQSLKSTVRLMLGSRYPMFVWWGPELICLYNDAYRDVLGPRHPWALGQPAHKTWSELWDVLGPQVDAVMSQGASTWNDRVLLVMQRKGFAEETYFTFSYSPCFNDSGEVGGVFCACTDETARVVGERRLQSLRLLSESVLDSHSTEEACEAAARALATNPHDLPFVLVYLQEGEQAKLVAQHGVPDASPLAPPAVALSATDAPWPFDRVLATRAAQEVGHVASWQEVAAGPWPESVKSAMVLPIPAPNSASLAGFIVAGLNPRRPLDDEYRDYLALLSKQVASGIADARAFHEEQARARALAELDRAKTTFFSNVSHELRTPLALMLAPIAELSELPQLQGEARESLLVAQRNGQRLQRLVNTLLDFSRIEAGRMQARFEPVDLGSFTAELASFFRSAAQKAGLAFEVDCPVLPQPVYVDRGMWEKIVFNLLSNALKYTLEGCITVRVLQDGASARLEVSDTGLGISHEAQPHLFERFFRVEGAHGRSIEGSGIGLALVAELVRMHGGSAQVRSEWGAGSTFSVALPLGFAHLPSAQVQQEFNPQARAGEPLGWLDEVTAWLESPASSAEAQTAPSPPDSLASLPRTGGGGVLVVDDNADMRAYLARLLAREHRVRTAADGVEALHAITQEAPDLILTDLMMPRMDGLQLLQRLRGDRATASVPVILLSARAGDEARIEALDAGADDFLVKPFHARELLARVAGMLKLGRVRREATVREQALRSEIENVLESITEGFIAVDAQWRFTYVNAAAEKIYGRSRESLLGGDIWQLFPDAVGSAFEPAYRRAMRERVAATVAGPYDPLGAWFEVNIYPVTSGGLAFYFRDLQHNRQLERSLRESEQRFREMAEAMPQIVFVADAGGHARYLNRQWSACTGLDSARSEDLPKVVHPDDLQLLHDSWSRAVRTAQPLAAEIRLRHAADGSYRWFLTRALPVRGDDGKVARWYGTCTDVDESRRNAEALAIAHAALQQADRRKDQFIATLAHELRNPLAPLRNGVQVLALGASPDAASRVQAMMSRQIEQLVRLVDDLLEVSRITSGKIELRRGRLSLGDVLASAAETSRPLVDAGGHAFHLDTSAAASLQVDGDPMRLGQVFANLINNAAKYTEHGGRIELHARRDGDEALVEVRDNGVGLPPEMLGEVFEPFVQIDRTAARAQGGLGIGLSIVKSLVALHGGTVFASSPGAGKGSSFTVRLPLIQSDPAAKTSVPGDAGQRSRPSAQGPSVLVVDDNRDAADSLASMLEIMGARPRVAYDGRDALCVAEADPPSLVLLDLGMPGMDGYEVARRLGEHARRDEMTLVALTGWGQSEDRQRTRAAGFDDHLVKPAEFDALQALLRRFQGTAAPSQRA